MSKRICNECEEKVPNGIDMAQSVKTGTWLCLRCFEKRLKKK